jgi:prepilin-type N-terminal cleavage/methylation domain-containing protein
MNNTARHQGFTLLELLIVCFLISISLALSIPSLRNTLLTDNLAAGSRKVISLVKTGRAKAVTNREAYLILYNSAERELWYQKVGDEETPDERSTITLPTGIRIEQIKQANGKTNHDPARDGVWISKQGYMDTTGIQLIDKANNRITMLISPFLPTIHVTEGAISFK